MLKTYKKKKNTDSVVFPCSFNMCLFPLICATPLLCTVIFLYIPFWKMMITFIDRGAVGTFNYGKSRIEVDEEHNWSRQPKHLTEAGTFNNGENGNAIVKGKNRNRSV